MAPRRRQGPHVAIAASAIALLGPLGVLSSPNHDELQGREAIQMAWQRYSAVPRPALKGRRLQEPDHCDQVAGLPWEHMRIGFDFLDADDVSQEIREHVGKNILGRAIEYWSRALRVHPVSEPLRADYMGRNCEKYGLAFDGRVIASEQHYTCEAAEAPYCGPHGLTIPAKYLRAKRVCTKGCPNLVETFAHLFQAAERVCDNCTDLPEGPGAEGYDFFVFVTLKDDFCEGDVQAHATTCVKDQCDRPIFGLINFCRAKISLEAEDTDRQVTTAVHELAHALAFSAHHFQYFRNADGSPKVPREAEDSALLLGAVPWSCRFGEAGTKYTFPDPEGDRRYIDLSESGIIGKFNERGLDNCPCPVGQKELLPGCILPPQPAFRTPKCNFRLTTPMVRQKVQEFFGCDQLQGAELENQPTSPCVIVSSHWEQRAFMGEVMVSAQVIQPTFLSEVTLALFHDSGWYLPDYGMADRLVKGVHWGYQQGCAFATKPCVVDGQTAFPRFWCTTEGSRSCSLDRRGEVQCSLGELPDGETLPDTVRYAQTPLLGFVAEADYCPFFHVRIINHDCTDKLSTTFPISNANFERETFGAASRCLESSLNGDVESVDGLYRAEPEKFTEARPRCYEVRCLGNAYEVWVSDLQGSLAKLGTCTEAGQALTGLSLQGAVSCAPPEELCGVEPAMHLVLLSDIGGLQGKAEALTGGSGDAAARDAATLSRPALGLAAAGLAVAAIAGARLHWGPGRRCCRTAAGDAGWTPGVQEGTRGMRSLPSERGSEGVAASE